MMQIFSDDPIHKKRARALAIIWTLLIFFLCFLPAKDIPEVDVPLMDKWVHFTLFGIFAFLWLLSLTSVHARQQLLVFLAAVVVGALVELGQGAITFLGRSMDLMDILADSIGGALGVLAFRVAYSLASKRHAHRHNNKSTHDLQK